MVSLWSLRCLLVGIDLARDVRWLPNLSRPASGCKYTWTLRPPALAPPFSTIVYRSPSSNPCLARVSVSSVGSYFPLPFPRRHTYSSVDDSVRHQRVMSVKVKVEGLRLHIFLAKSRIRNSLGAPPPSELLFFEVLLDDMQNGVGLPRPCRNFTGRRPREGALWVK